METKEITVSPDIIESLIINGDLSKLDPKQKVEYYQKYCFALGLNPVTQPFMLLTLNGKQKLYCGREGSSQLSKVHEVSHEIISTEFTNGIYLVKMKAAQGSRFTTSTGAVSIDGLKGEALCNALMKAETKAKRRSTLDLLGLGMLDETEVETIPGAKTEDIAHTEVSHELPESFKTLDEKIADAKTFLYAAQDKKSLKKAFESLSAEMQTNEIIIQVALDCQEEIKKQNV